MNREQLNADFFPSSLMLKLFSFEPKAELESKIILINEYVDEVRDSYEEDVVRIHLNNQIAFSYWMAERHEFAIKHFKIVVEKMEPADSPILYFQALNLLIKGNRILSNLPEAEKWAALALENHALTHTISNLHNLNEYAEVLLNSGKSFDKKYNSIIQSIIDEFGFPETLEDPIETIRSMNKTHSLWAKKLTALEANYLKPGLESTIKKYEEYAASCEIEWYRNYSLNSLKQLKLL